MRAVKQPEIANFYVYVYVRTVASEHGAIGSPYYVGKGRGKRAYRNGGRGIARPRERVNIILAGQDLPEDDAFALEKRLIKEYGRIDLGTGSLRNKSDGGEGPSGHIRTAEWTAKLVAARVGFKHTDKAKAQMSASRTGSKRSAETKSKMSAWQKGRKSGPMSDEQKAKIAATLKGRPKTESFKVKISEANRRRKLSEESKAKISRSLTGKTRSEDSKAKQSASSRAKHRVPHNKGKKASEQVRAKMSAAHKAQWEEGRYDNRKKSRTSPQQLV